MLRGVVQIVVAFQVVSEPDWLVRQTNILFGRFGDNLEKGEMIRLPKNDSGGDFPSGANVHICSCKENLEVLFSSWLDYLRSLFSSSQPFFPSGHWIEDG